MLAEQLIRRPPKQYLRAGPAATQRNTGGALDRRKPGGERQWNVCANIGRKNQHARAEYRRALEQVKLDMARRTGNTQIPVYQSQKYLNPFAWLAALLWFNHVVIQWFR